jgi:MoxR-like ATPase
VSDQLNVLKNELSHHVVGQERVIERLIVSLLANGHCLLEGVPGVGKTMMTSTLAQMVGGTFSRIQFTPDLLPSDIVGTRIYRASKESFDIELGPIFANFVLADEINRTPPKTQSSLLEAMQEKAVTAAGKNYKLPNPFFVLATQNPIEQEGTYPLPEAQLDRFMFNIWVDYPSYIEELAIVKSTTSDNKVTLNHILNAEEIIHYQDLIRRIPVTDNVLEYAVKLVGKTRANSEFAPQITKDFITWGAGPRASQNLIIGAKCHAALNGKYSPDIEDVKAVAKPILRHRLVRNYRAEAEGYTMDKIIDELL